MRTLLALLLAIPLVAQQPEEKKPDAAAPQAEAKPESKPDAAASQAGAKPEAKPGAAASQPESKPDAKPAESPAPTPPVEQNINGSIDFGYRWRTDVAGNFNAYRSVVNLGEGPKLFGWEFSIQDPKKHFFDRIDTQGIGWGGDPWTTARVDARKMGVYDLHFDYRNIAYFNYLPSYADPLMNIQRGFFLDENSFDNRRRMLDVQLDLRPGKRVIPYFNYNRDWNSGHGITTFQTDANEYPVSTQYGDTTNSYRGGVRIEMRKYHVTLEQGGVDYGDNQTVTNSDRNTGNLMTPFLGQTLFLGSLSQKYDISGTSIYTKVLGTGHPASWVDLYGQYLYSRPKNDVSYNQTATGQFVNLSNLLFYTGQANILTAAIRQPHTTASAGAEVRPFRRLRIIESWTTNRLNNDSGATGQIALINPASTTLTASTQRLVWNYSQQEVDALFDVSSKLTLRGGYRYIWGDAQVPAPNLTEAGSSEDVQLRQQVGIAGLTFRFRQKFTANFDFEGASSSSAYFRTSLYNYQRVRLRGRYQATQSLSFSAVFTVLNNDNPTPTINYTYLNRGNSASVLWAPAGGKRISLMGDYTRATVNSTLSYRVPQDGSTALDHYVDDAHLATALVDVALPGYSGMVPKVSFGGSLFISSGSRPTRYYQPLGRLSIPIMKHLSWNSEWQYYGFGEQFYLYEGFRTHVFMTGLRLSR